MSSHDDRRAAGFQLELQDTADTSKCFPRPRKTVLANGLVIHTRWYRPDVIEKPQTQPRPDVRLANGIVLRAATYKPPCYGPGWHGYTAKQMDYAYKRWLTERDKKRLAAAPTPTAKARRRKT